MNTLQDTLIFFVTITLELTVLFVVISFAVGLLQAYVPAATVRGVLTRRRGMGNVIGAAFGSITPFCSCSTIPMTIGLLNSGAPFGSVMSYLVASPLVNPIIVGLFWLTFGWQITVVYTVFAFMTAVLVGALWEKLGLADAVKHVRVSGGKAEDEQARGFRDHMRLAGAEAWLQLKTVLPYLLVGVAIGAAIYGYLPQEWVVSVAGPDNPLAVPVAAVIGVPMYIRVETMIPIGLVLTEKGMSLGAVMALVIGGAGASIPEVSLLASIFKARLVAAFLLTILAVAIGAGFAFNAIF